MNIRPRYEVREVLTLAIPTRDTVLSVATPEEVAGSATARIDIGKVWNGLRSAFDSLDPDHREQLRPLIENYFAQGSSMRIGGSGSLTTGTGVSDPNASVTDSLRGMHAGINKLAAINQRNRDFWARPESAAAGIARTAATATNMRAKVGNINAANAAFWAARNRAT